MPEIISYANRGATEHISVDALMSFEQFSRYNNSFGSKYFMENWKTGTYRAAIQEAWDRLSGERPELAPRIGILLNHRGEIFENIRNLVKAGTPDEDPQLQDLERQFRELDSENLPLLYEAYLILHPVVKDNEILFG